MKTETPKTKTIKIDTEWTGAALAVRLTETKRNRYGPGGVGVVYDAEINGVRYVIERHKWHGLDARWAWGAGVVKADGTRDYDKRRIYGDTLELLIVGILRGRSL